MSAQYDSNDRPASGGSTVKIVLIIVGGVVLVIAIVCGGLLYLAFVALSNVNKMTQGAMASLKAEFELIEVSTQAARQFVTEIDNGDLDSAYAMTAPKYKERTTRKAFDELVKKHNLVGANVPPGEPDAVPINRVGPAVKNFTYSFQRQTKTGKIVSLHIDVAQEGEEWIVTNWTVIDTGRGGVPNEGPPGKNGKLEKD